MKKISIILCIVSISVFSCKKSIDSSKQQHEKVNVFETPQIKEGRMTFKTTESFYTFIDFLDSRKQEYVDSLSITLTNFHSLLKELKFNYKKYEEGTPENHIKDLMDFRFPTSYLYTLNTDGEVMIGDTIIWYS